MGQTLEDICRSLPEEINGWQKNDQFENYDPENLYTYINGGAELFISYSFLEMVSLKFEKENEAEIVLDIFDMGSPANAFGVFTQNREETDSRFGQGGEYNSGLLVFWQDRFYVSIMAYPETSQKQEVIFKIADYLIKSVGKNGSLPQILNLLPPAGLQTDSIRYFHHYIWQNSLLYISPKNILNINESTQCLLARYKREGGSCLLLLVRYPDQAQAAGAEKHFRQEYLGDEYLEIVRREEDLFAGCRRFNDLLLVVLAASEEKIAREIMIDFATGLEKGVLQ